MRLPTKGHCRLRQINANESLQSSLGGGWVGGREGGRAGGKDPGGLLAGKSRRPSEKPEPEASYVAISAHYAFCKPHPSLHQGWVYCILPGWRTIIITLHFSDPEHHPDPSWESAEIQNLPVGPWQAN